MVVIAVLLPVLLVGMLFGLDVLEDQLFSSASDSGEPSSAEAMPAPVGEVSAVAGDHRGE